MGRSSDSWPQLSFSKPLGVNENREDKDMAAIALSRSTLGNIAAPARVPGFDVSRVAPGIVHLGFGGFHRAHMARYTHNLMERDEAALAWGIVGAGLLPADARMKQSLAPQDNLYTLVERSGETDAVAVIGSVADVIFAGEESGALLEAIDDPRIRIVSLTITENGYCLDRSTDRLDFDNPLIKHDLEQPRAPSSAIGILVEAFRRRRAGGAPAFTAMSCDNIQHNGHVLHAAVRDLAMRLDPGLAAWIEANASFPSTMVDRITPGTVPADIAYLQERFGIIDRWPVFSEAFLQWVIEDRFVLGRPEWETVGAQFVEDVAPYEFMKLRLLNASHLAVAGLGQLCGYALIDESMADPRIAGFMRALMDRETGQTLRPVPGVDLDAYKRTLLARFANPKIKDTVQRVNTDAPLATLVDSARDRLAVDAPIDLLSLAVAAWLRRVRGEDEAGAAIDIRHPLAATLRERAIEGGADPRPLLSLSSLFGTLGEEPRFVEPVAAWLAALYRDGARETLRQAATRLAF